MREQNPDGVLELGQFLKDGRRLDQLPVGLRLLDLQQRGRPTEGPRRLCLHSGFKPSHEAAATSKVPVSPLEMRTIRCKKLATGCAQRAPRGPESKVDASDGARFDGGVCLHPLDKEIRRGGKNVCAFLEGFVLIRPLDHLIGLGVEQLRDGPEQTGTLIQNFTQTLKSPQLSGQLHTSEAKTLYLILR